MDKYEIIEMASEAGFLINELHCSPPILSFVGQEEAMQAFAKLVEDAAFKRWAAQTRLAVQDEREACAKVCETARETIWKYHEEHLKAAACNVCTNIAISIRARS